MTGRRRWGRSLSRSLEESWAAWSAVGLAVLALVVGGLAVYTVAFHDPNPPSASAAELPSSTPSTSSASATPEPKGPVVAWVGDSYSAGAGGTSGGFVRAVSEAKNWDSQNLGVGGTGYVVRPDQAADEAQTVCGRDYCPALPETIEAAAKMRPDIVVVSGGRQDVTASSGEVQDSVTGYYKGLRRALPKARIIAMSPLWDDDPSPEELGAMGRVVRTAAEGVNARYIDLGQPLAGHPELVAANGFQPNDAGYDAIADVMEAKLQKPR